MKYLKRLSEIPSFSQKGLDGFKFNLENKNITISFIDVYKGHDKYSKNIESTYFYYIISGNGKFKINDKIYEVKEKNIIEIPVNTEFTYLGNMKMLLIANPPFNKDKDIQGRTNDLF